MTNVIAALLIASPLLAFSCVPTGERYTEEFHQTYQVEEGISLEIHNANGDIRIVSWDEDFVDVYALKKTKIAESELEKAEIICDVGEKMTVRTEYKDRNARISVDYRIKVPKDIEVEIAQTSNGDINVEKTRIEGSIITSNGDIEIKRAEGNLNAKTSNGDIIIDGGLGLSCALTSNGDIKADIIEISKDITVATSNGSVKVRINPELDTYIEMATSLGKLSTHNLDVEVIKKDRNYLKAKLGNGGYLIKATSTLGDVDLYKLD